MRGKCWPQIKGRSGSFETHIEIPITVHYDFQPAERQTRHDPGCPSAICINSFDFGCDEFGDSSLGVSLNNYIIDHHQGSIEQECWDDMEGDI